MGKEKTDITAMLWRYHGILGGYNFCTINVYNVSNKTVMDIDGISPKI